MKPSLKLDKSKNRNFNLVWQKEFYEKNIDAISKITTKMY